MRKLITLMAALLIAAMLQGCGAGSAGMDSGNSGTDGTLFTSSGSSAAPTITFTGFAIVQVDGALSGKVVAFFSEDMDASTINTSNFVIRGPDGKEVPGSVLYIGVTAVFTPTARFSAQTRYVASMSTGVRSLSGVPMSRPHTWTFTTPDPSELTGVLVKVASSYPAAYETAVPVNTGVNVTFNQVMDPATINNSTFGVFDPSGTKVPGNVHYTGRVASFVPAAPLTPNTTYRAVVSASVTSLSGVPMDADQHWPFTTGTDGAVPQVLATAPLQGDSNVSLAGDVVADFNVGMDTATVTTGSFTLRDAGGNTVDGTVAYTGDVAVFTPDAPLQPLAVYTATISTAAHSAGGTPLSEDYSWSFTTGSAASAQAPSVLFTSPAPYDTGAAIANAISVAFDQPLDPASISAAAVQVTASDGTPVSGTLSCSGNMLFFMPDQSLHFNSQYTVTLSPGIRDMAGGYLGQAYSWSFTTLEPVIL